MKTKSLTFKDTMTDANDNPPNATTILKRVERIETMLLELVISLRANKSLHIAAEDAFYAVKNGDVKEDHDYDIWND